jgi:DNA-binding beta-propeller fold protein YncE
MRACLCLALTLLALAGCADDPERFDRPTNVAFAANGDVYVADGYNNSRIARFSADGRFLGAFGEKGFGKGQLNTPHGIATDEAGKVYVADRENARVQVFDAEGGYLTEWKGGELGRPWAISFGEDGFFYVVDGGDQDPAHPRGHVLRLDHAGRILDRFSSFGDGPGQLEWGHGVSVGKDGSVYVVDVEGGRVQKFRRSP